MRILIFGGTGEARELASRLVGMGHEVTSSLAGRTQNPLLPQGNIRTGGFGGVDNLACFIRDGAFDWLVDATHPYAASMSSQLVDAVRVSGVNFLRLQRPQWAVPSGAAWQEVPDINAALNLLPGGAVPFLALGHKDIGAVSHWPQGTCIIRLIEAPDIALPGNVHVILSRPPHSLDDEIALMRAHDITHLVTKNAGGAQTRAKIDAAAELGLPILVIRRPELPPAPEVTTVEAAISVVQASASNV